MSDSPVYVLHSGHVTNPRDGSESYVTASALQWCYGLRASQCTIYRHDPPRTFWIEPPNAVHLYPREDGNYTLPEPP